jgi:hypothetical protein
VFLLNPKRARFFGEDYRLRLIPMREDKMKPEPELARRGAVLERLEAFIQRKVREGATTVGTYPPDAETLAAYAKWNEKFNGN